MDPQVFTSKVKAYFSLVHHLQSSLRNSDSTIIGSSSAYGLKFQYSNLIHTSGITTISKHTHALPFPYFSWKEVCDTTVKGIFKQQFFITLYLLGTE